MPSAITVADKSRSNGKKSDTAFTGDVSGEFQTRTSFHTLSPHQESGSPGADLSQYTVKSAEEDLNEIKEEFQKFEKPPFQPVEKVRTFAVSRDGDLISEHSDSDKSQASAKNGNTVGSELTNYTLSTMDSTGKFRSTVDSTGLSQYTLPDTSADTRLSEFTNRSSGKSDSVSSNPKSSSFTNVTSDPSLNATGASVLSQYTLNETKPETTNNQSASALDSMTEQDYIQDRFASLDNLISESKHLIARHKQVIERTKTMSPELPELPKQPPPPLIKTGEITTSLPTTSSRKGNHSSVKYMYLCLVNFYDKQIL